MFPNETAICSTGTTYPVGNLNLKTVLKGKRYTKLINKKLLFPYKEDCNFSQFGRPVNHKNVCSIKFYSLSLFMSCAFFVGVLLDEQFLIGSFSF